METFRARMSSLSLCQSYGSFPGNPLPLPSSWTGTTPDSFPLPEQAPHCPTFPPAACLPPSVLGSPRHRSLAKGPPWRRVRALSCWQPGSRPAHPLCSAFVPPCFHSPPPTISSLLSHSLPSEPWVLNYNWDPGNAFLSTIFMGWADTFN